MGLYRVTFTTTLLVDSDNEKEAINIGKSFLKEEVNNGLSEFLSIQKLQFAEQLQSVEKGSLPWRSPDRHKEPEVTVEEILKKS